jgi:hypothetical protein
MVFADLGKDRPAFLGSCFALRDSRAVVTAAHCLGDVPTNNLYVRMPRIIVVNRPDEPQMNALLVDEVVRHPEADVAILRIPSVMEGVGEPFWKALPTVGLGEDFFAFGYPENVRTDQREPTARLFKGYVQRLIYGIESHMGYRYTALEMDFPCPAGLSGGPLFRPDAPQMVIGVATENFESTTSCWWLRRPS